MIPVETLREFKRIHMGWISSDGELIPCNTYDHFKVLAGRPEFAELVTRFHDLVEQNDYEKAEFAESVDDGEHIPWHCWEDDPNIDTTRRALYEAVYRAGWARVGSWSSEIEVESIKETLTKVKPIAEFIAEMLDSGLHLREYVSA